MTKDEYNRLREECTQANDIAACLEQTNDDLTRALAANVDALVKSNAQCAEYLRQNEQLTAELDRMKGDPLPIKLVGKLKDAEDSNKTLHSELVEVRAALAATTEQRDSLKQTLDEWERGDTKPHERVTADDVADHVAPPVLPMCMTCHGCGSVLYPSPAGDYFGCGDLRCTRSNTKHWHPGCTIGPYAGPCKSATPVRHE